MKGKIIQILKSFDSKKDYKDEWIGNDNLSSSWLWLFNTTICPHEREYVSDSELERLDDFFMDLKI